MTDSSLDGDALFDVAPYLVPDDSAAPADATDGEKRRARQAARITVGLHPLSYLAPGLRLHPGAPRVIADDGGGRRKEPFRCGSCVHRVVIGGAHAGEFPKCLAGTRVVPVPNRVRRDGEPETRVIRPRATGAVTSDVRAWWPACTDWTPFRDTPPEESTPDA